MGKIPAEVFENKRRRAKELLTASPMTYDEVNAIIKNEFGTNINPNALKEIKKSISLENIDELESNKDDYMELELTEKFGKYNDLKLGMKVKFNNRLEKEEIFSQYINLHLILSEAEMKIRIHKELATKVRIYRAEIKKLGDGEDVKEEKKNIVSKLNLARTKLQAIENSIKEDNIKIEEESN